MHDKNLEELHDKNAIPALLLEGVVPLSEVLQSIQLGEYTGRWIVEQVFALARIKPDALSAAGNTTERSDFDTPQAVAAMHCLEALISCPFTRNSLVNYIWKSVGCRHQEWLTKAVSRLSPEAAIFLALGKPEGNRISKHLQEPSNALMSHISGISDHDMVDFAHDHACFSILYDLTGNKAVLKAASQVDRDKIMAGDLGL